MTDRQYEILEMAVAGAFSKAYETPLDLSQMALEMHAFALKLAEESMIRLDEALRD